MKHYLLLVGSLMMLWGTEAMASNIEFEIHHHNSMADKDLSSHSHHDFIGDAFQGTWSDKGHAADTTHNGYFAGATGHTFNDFEYKDRDRYGDDDGKYNDDKYKVKGDYQYSNHDGDYDRDHDRDKDSHKDRDKDHKHHDKHHHPKVPEPASLLLLGAGLAGIGIWRRKTMKLEKGR